MGPIRNDPPGLGSVDQPSGGFDAALRLLPARSSARPPLVSTQVVSAGEVGAVLAKVYGGPASALPPSLQDEAAALLGISPEALHAPGQTVLLAMRTNAAGTEVASGAGLVSKGHGVASDGTAQALTGLVAWGGADTKAVFDTARQVANAAGTHLVVAPPNHVAAQEISRFALDFGVGDVRGGAHGNDAVRGVAMPALAGKPFEELSPAQKSAWAALNHGGLTTAGTLAGGALPLMGAFSPNGPHENGVPVLPATIYLSGGTTASLSLGGLAGGLFGHTGLPQAEPPIAHGRPDSTPSPYRLRRDGDGLAALDPGQRSAVQHMAAALQASTSAAQDARDKVNAVFDRGSELVQKARTAVGDAVADHIWAPVAATPVGQGVLVAAASRTVSKAGPAPTGSGDLATPQRSGHRFIPLGFPDHDGSGVAMGRQRPVPLFSANGTVPMFPGTGEMDPATPTAQGTVREVKRSGRLSFQVGSPQGVPAAYWAGTPGMAFGKPVAVDWTLRPAILKPLQAGVGVLHGTMNVALGATAVSLAAGALTGNLQVGHFVIGTPDLTPRDKTVERIVNYAKGMTVNYAQVNLPLVPKSWNMTSTVALGGKAADWQLNGALLPGQPGVAPWANVTDGRLTAVFQNTAGRYIGFAAAYIGAPNLEADTLVAFNLPRVTRLVTTVNAVPTAERRTPADVMVGARVSPLSMVWSQGIAVDKVRVIRGGLISPVQAGLEVGTKGVQVKTALGRPDVLPFGSISPNPAYETDSGIGTSAKNTLDWIGGLLSGKPATR